MYAFEMMFCFKVQQHQLTVALLGFETPVKRILAAVHFFVFFLGAIQSSGSMVWYIFLRNLMALSQFNFVTIVVDKKYIFKEMRE